MFSVKTGTHFSLYLSLSNEILIRVISQSKPTHLFLPAFFLGNFNSFDAVQESLLLLITTEVSDS